MLELGGSPRERRQMIGVPVVGSFDEMPPFLFTKVVDATTKETVETL